MTPSSWSTAPSAISSQVWRSSARVIMARLRMSDTGMRPLLNSLVEALARIRMRVDPVAGNVAPARYPDVIVLHHIVEQPFEAGCAGRMSGQAHVQADRHHFRLGGAFTVEHVEGVAHEGEPVIGRADRAGVFAVVVGQRVRDDEMRLAADRLPERQLVPVVVRVVEEAALLDEQAPGVDARPIAAIPAGGTLAQVHLERADRLADVLALVVLRQLVMLDPTPAVRTHIESGRADGGSRRRMTLDGKRTAEDRQRQVARLEQAHQTPETDAAAVFEHALAGEVAALGNLAVARFGEPDLG